MHTTFNPIEWNAFGVHDVCVNSSIVDKGTSSENKSTPRLRVNACMLGSIGSLMLFPESIHLKLLIYRLQNSSLHFHLHNGWVYLNIMNPYLRGPLKVKQHNGFIYSVHVLALIIPINACYYLELGSAIMSYSKVHFSLTNVPEVVQTL